jgi:hypothetical protein
VHKYGTAKQATNDKITRRRQDAVFMPDNHGKNTDTQSYYVIPIAFPRQQWLRERASMLRLYVHCLSFMDTQSTVIELLHMQRRVELL